MSKVTTPTGAPAVHHQASRRLFMRQASALSLAAGAGAPLALNLLAAGSAAAQGASDYKAIVCLFMFGGNDSFNTVLPVDAPSWAEYSKVRPEGSIRLQPPGVLPNLAASAGSPARLGGVLPIYPTNPGNHSFALHPELRDVKTLFEQQRLAIIANIGPLERPTSKQQYLNERAHPLPPRLFSHNDQQSIWQTMQPEGATVGWGGRMADLIESSANRSTFTAISASGSAVWLSGQEVRQYQVSGAGPLRLGSNAAGQVYGSPDVAAKLAELVKTSAGTHLFEDHLARLAKRSIDAEEKLREDLAASAPGNPSLDPALQFLNPLTNQREFSPLAHQLQMVARLIALGRANKGPRRQVFFVGLGGFDTHNGQNQTHALLMARVNHALGYFDAQLGEAARNSVTTFTASDFGRTFTSNGDGTDHGWGAHHFVMGGAVRGGDVYGRFPTLSARTAGYSDLSNLEQLRNGALLPSTSVDQLGGTLGRWFGLDARQLDIVFPNLKNFNIAPSNMAFYR